ncbi:hypothetical protein VNO78_28814 [Psophocarpus tetragonolobus]|uniref:Uncharacterized protein n=1 Tax=Psophocarpus tetragonolobus TaxID=3891 RepID=A0AAN9WZ00_PSOTE
MANWVLGAAFVPIVGRSVQKIVLAAVRNPMKMLGDVLELWLNRLSSNGGLIKLLLSIITGRDYTQTCYLTMFRVLGRLCLIDGSSRMSCLRKESLSAASTSTSHEPSPQASPMVQRPVKQFVGCYSDSNKTKHAHAVNSPTNSSMFELLAELKNY